MYLLRVQFQCGTYYRHLENLQAQDALIAEVVQKAREKYCTHEVVRTDVFNLSSKDSYLGCCAFGA